MVSSQPHSHETLLNLTSNPAMLGELKILTLSLEYGRHVLAAASELTLHIKLITHGAVACCAAPIMAAVVGSTIAVMSSVERMSINFR